MLSPFAPDIWIADGPVVALIGGFPYPTRMAVVRLRDGGLFVWSPVALCPQMKQDVDAVGPVRFLVSPNMLHHLYLGEWRAAYPDARMFASPRLRKRRADLAFEADLGDPPDPGWAADIDQVLVHGSLVMTEAVFFHRHSATAIFADLIESLPTDWFKGWRGVAARIGGITEANPGAPRDWRLTFTNREAARAALGRILAWPIERVVIAHGQPVEANGAAFVRDAFAWLLGAPT